MELNKSYGKTLFLSLLIFVLVGGVFGVPRVARADPHAIFYTATAQQQLFWNTLAALDQADYVEGQDRRQQLAERRAAADGGSDFTQTQQQLINTTDIDSSSLSSVGPSSLLSRLITLEGTDLYTDFLVRSVGAESARRASTNALLTLLCDTALGTVGCNSKAGNDISAEDKARKKNSAQVTNPLGWVEQPFSRGVAAALSSGSYKDEDNRDAMLASYQGRAPYAHSPTLAIWRAYIKNNSDWDEGQKQRQSDFLDRLLIETAQGYISDGVFNVGEDGAGGYFPVTNPYPFDGVTFDDKGYLVATGSGGFPVTAVEVGEAAAQATLAQLQISLLANAAAERIKTQQDLVEDQGLLASTDIVAKPFPRAGGGADLNGELYSEIVSPVAIKTGAAQSLTSTLGNIAVNQQPVSAEAVQKEGDATSFGDVLGINSDDEGQVAGIFDTALKDLLYDLLGDSGEGGEARKVLSPNSNRQAPFLDPGAAQVLNTVSGGELYGILGLGQCSFTFCFD